MYIKVETMSGAQYQFDPVDLTWWREGENPIHGLPQIRSTKVNSGQLTEWPAIIIAQRIMFDDTESGVVYTTPVLKAEVIYEGNEKPE